MYLDLISQSNYMMFNINVARLLGLDAAVYLSELLSISEKATRKNCLVGGYVLLDREYVANRTTIDIENQLDIDSKLVDIGVMEKRSVNEINLNIKQLAYIITKEDEPVRDEVVATMRKAKHLSKKVKDDYNLDALKRSIRTDCQELRNAYYEWIDCVYHKDGFMTKKAVTYAQDEIDRYCNHDLDMALEVLRIASISAYRDISWAISMMPQKKTASNNGKYTLEEIRAFGVERA